ncbi:MAG: hypothetical protein ACXWW6_03805 [Candidatus Limnocylindrales bacterium]
MDLSVASVREGDRWRWRDLRTVVAIVAAVATGVGLGIANRRSLTRRRALVVGGTGTVVIGPWFLIGLPIVMIHYAVSGHPGPPYVRLYFYEPVPALIGMVAAFVAVAILGSLFRRPSNRQ